MNIDAIFMVGVLYITCAVMVYTNIITLLHDNPKKYGEVTDEDIYMAIVASVLTPVGVGVILILKCKFKEEK